jgi:poly(A) polymerase
MSRLFDRVLREGHIGSADAAKTGALEICKTLQDHGHEAYYVGGCVRDMIIGVEPKDYDIICSKEGEDVIDVFPGSTSLSNPPEGRIVQITVGGEDFETMICRMPIEENLKMRDITINAMAYDPIADSYLDPCGGKEDAKTKKIKLTDFMEQKLRNGKAPLATLRLFRFASRYGWPIDPSSYDAVHEFIDMGGVKEFKKVKAERLKTEIAKISEGKAAEKMIAQLTEMGIWEQLEEAASR